MNNLIYKLKKSDFADKITLIVAMVLLVVLFGALNRNYVTGANMINILIACSLTGFVAIGETNLIIANQNARGRSGDSGAGDRGLRRLSGRSGQRGACHLPQITALYCDAGHHVGGARHRLYPLQRQGGSHQRQDVY